jgi:hypothetical protein
LKSKRSESGMGMALNEEEKVDISRTGMIRLV